MCRMADDSRDFSHILLNCTNAYSVEAVEMRESDLAKAICSRAGNQRGCLAVRERQFIKIYTSMKIS